jgi:hypothetical protein
LKKKCEWKFHNKKNCANGHLERKRRFGGELEKYLAGFFEGNVEDME